MELVRFFRILLRYWWLVLIPVAITAAVSIPALLSGPATAGGYTTMIRYSAAQVLDAIPNRDGDYQDVWLASELTVNALTDWIRTRGFAERVAARAELAGVTLSRPAISFAADNQRSVGQLFISYPDDGVLAVVANAAIATLRDDSAEAFPQLGGAPAQITVLDDVTIQAAPPPLADRFGPLVRVGLGLVAGVGLALLAHYLDPVLRRRDDVEAVGLGVIGSIPRY